MLTNNPDEISFYSLLLIITSYCQAQTADVFGLKQCFFTTTGEGAQLGLKAKFTIPCNWKKLKGKSKDGNIKFIHYTDEVNGVTLAEIFNVRKPTIPLTTQQLDAKATAEGNNDEGFVFVSGRRLTIGGAEAVEVVRKKGKSIMEPDITSYTTSYHIAYKDYTIIMVFLVSGDEQTATKMQLAYKPLMEKFATGTTFLQ